MKYFSIKKIYLFIYFIGQDVLPLTFKIFPQRSESVDNGNRISPTTNGLQRVCVS